MLPTSEAHTPSGDVACMENEYQKLLFSGGLAQDFPRFVRQLKGQINDQSADWGRSCVLEFPQEGLTTVTRFDNPKKLHDHLRNPRGTSRRLWLLEDVSLNWITVLGAHLQIPSSFFASHWADPSGADFNDRHTFFPNPECRFLLKYPRFRTTTVQGLKGDSRDPVLAIKCNVERCFFPGGYEDRTYEDPKVSRTYHNLSFWGNQLSSKTWDAVLLVDPPFHDIITMDPEDCLPEDLVVRNPDDLQGTRSFYPAIYKDELLSQDYEGWNASRPIPELISMYEDIINCRREWECEVEDSPKSCTKFCRKLVIGFWLQFVRRRYRNLLTQSKLGAVKPTKTGYVNRTGWLNKNLDFNYEENIFGNLISAHHKQAALLLEIWANMRALHLPLSENHVCKEEDLDVPLSKDHVREGKVPDAWERRGWNEVQYMTNHIVGMSKLLTQAYQHSVTMKEAQTANKIGRSVARITNLAIIFTPMSAIAGIFSINGQFAAGETHWWVFWVICFVVLVLISLFFFGDDIKSLLLSARPVLFIRRWSRGNGQDLQDLDIELAERGLLR